MSVYRVPRSSLLVTLLIVGGAGAGLLLIGWPLLEAIPELWAFLLLLAGMVGAGFVYGLNMAALRVAIDVDTLELRSLFSCTRVSVSRIVRAESVGAEYSGQSYQIRLVLDDGHRLRIPLFLFESAARDLQRDLTGAGVPLVPSPLREHFEIRFWLKAHRRFLTAAALVLWGVSAFQVELWRAAAGPLVGLISQFSFLFPAARCRGRKTRDRRVSLIATIVGAAALMLNDHKDSWNFLAVLCGFGWSWSLVGYACIYWRRARRRTVRTLRQR